MTCNRQSVKDNPFMSDNIPLLDIQHRLETHVVHVKTHAEVEQRLAAGESRPLRVVKEERGDHSLKEAQDRFLCRRCEGELPRTS